MWAFVWFGLAKYLLIRLGEGNRCGRIVNKIPPRPTCLAITLCASAVFHSPGEFQWEKSLSMECNASCFLSAHCFVRPLACFYQPMICHLRNGFVLSLMRFDEDGIRQYNDDIVIVLQNEHPHKWRCRARALV